jgi:hypothetical protein
MTRKDIFTRLSSALDEVQTKDSDLDALLVLTLAVNDILQGVRKDPLDMPEFTIKAKDALSYPAVQHYRELCALFGLVNQMVEVEIALQEFQDWQDSHREHTRLPDHKHVAVSS